MGLITCFAYYVFLIFNGLSPSHTLGTYSGEQQPQQVNSAFVIQVCQLLGAFYKVIEIRLDYPVESTANVEDQVDFLLWTRQNPDVADKLVLNNLTALQQSHFQKDLPTRILIHGYGDTGTTGWVKNVRDAYFIKGKCRLLYFSCT